MGWGWENWEGDGGGRRKMGEAQFEREGGLRTGGVVIAAVGVRRGREEAGWCR